MNRTPHFYHLKSRLGMINLPWNKDVYNIGVEQGSDYILTPAFEQSFAGSASDLLEFPVPERINRNNSYEVICEYSHLAKELIQSTLKPQETQVVVGGDHSVSMPSLATLLERIDPTSVGYIRIDSHPDILNRASTTTGNFHGMWFRPFIDEFDEEHVATCTGGNRLQPEQLLFIGNLDSEAAEKEVMKSRHIQNVSVEDLRNTRAAMQSHITSFVGRYNHIHLDIDIDGFDGAVAPATGLPAPHGLLYEDVSFLLDLVAAHPSISVDLVEVNPLKEGGSATVAFAQKLLRHVLTGTAS
jgi:arginase